MEPTVLASVSAVGGGVLAKVVDIVFRRRTQQKHFQRRDERNDFEAIVEGYEKLLKSALGEVKAQGLLVAILQRDIATLRQENADCKKTTERLQTEVEELQREMEELRGGR